MQNVTKTLRLNVLKKLGKSQDIIVLLKRDKRNEMVILDRVVWSLELRMLTLLRTSQTVTVKKRLRLVSFNTFYNKNGKI